MRMVKGAGHIVGSETNRFTSFSFHTNRPCHSGDRAMQNLTSKIQGQGHGQGQYQWLYSGLIVQSISYFLFRGNWIILSQDISNWIISDAENSGSRSGITSNPIVTF